MYYIFFAYKKKKIANINQVLRKLIEALETLYFKGLKGKKSREAVIFPPRLPSLHSPYIIFNSQRYEIRTK